MMKAISFLSKNMHIWACLLSSHFQKWNSGRDLLFLNINTCTCSGLFLSTWGEFLQSLLFINRLTTFYSPKVTTPLSQKALSCCSFSHESIYTLCVIYTFMSANIIRKNLPLKKCYIPKPSRNIFDYSLFCIRVSLIFFSGWELATFKGSLILLFLRQMGSEII